jgi:hypothetical protein
MANEKSQIVANGNLLSQNDPPPINPGGSPCYILMIIFHNIKYWIGIGFMAFAILLVLGPIVLAFALI